MKSSARTDIGRVRETNQDYLFASDETVGGLPSLFIIADGMGGHRGGEFASRMAVEKIVEFVEHSRGGDASRILKEAAQEANSYLFDYAGTHDEMNRMGTTIVAAAIEAERLTVANVGDSRLYIAGGKLEQITMDHSLVQEMVRIGELNSDLAESHPDKHIITRAVGIDRDIRVDLFEMRLSPGQTILMCSDGLSNMLCSDEIYENLKLDLTPDKKADRLIELANRHGGKDNITLIVIEPEVRE